jgi:hypothetical protein
MRLALTFLVYVIVAPTVAGIVLTALLSTDAHGLRVMDVIGPLMAGSFVLALPVAYIVSRSVARRFDLGNA